MAIVNNSGFNNPALGQAFDNIASMFAPNSNSDIVANNNSLVTKAKLASDAAAAARVAGNRNKLQRGEPLTLADMYGLGDFDPTKMGIAYDERAMGTLQLFRKQSRLDGAADDIAVLRQYGVPYEVLDRDGCVAAEPGLASARAPIVGGLRLPDDETGDCYMFTQRLATVAETYGVRFIYGARIDGMSASGARVESVRSSVGTFGADTYVVTLGSFSAAMLRTLGISVPVFPVKGYSTTVPIVNERRASQSTVMDETYKVAITRLGDRIRGGGTAEVGNYEVRLHPKRRVVLDRSLTDLFPDSGDLSRSAFWSGLRPSKADLRASVSECHLLAQKRTKYVQ